jgi:anti-sigma regulatory factor (Ser/Thr protein kinase)
VSRGPVTAGKKSRTMPEERRTARDSGLDTERERLLQTRFAAEAGRLREVRQQVMDAAGRAGLAAEPAAEIALAISEACANIIEHGYGGRAGEAIVLTVDREPGRLVFVLEDDAPRIDPAKIVSRDLADLRPGGLGVRFMREIMSEVSYLPGPERGNRLELVKEL